MPTLVRIQSSKGQLGRQEFPSDATVGEVVSWVETAKKVKITQAQLMAAVGRKKLRVVGMGDTLSQIGYKTQEHMLYCDFEGEVVTKSVGSKVIRSDGSVGMKEGYVVLSLLSPPLVG